MKRMFLKMGGRLEQGFTLIELLVTLAVIALMIGVGVPMYGSFTEGSAVSGATADLIAALNESRSRAVSERAQVRLEAINDRWVNGWRSVRVSDEEVLFVAGRTDDGTILIEETGGATEVAFDREGRSVASAFTVRTNKPGAEHPVRTINMSALGRIEVKKTID